MRDCTCLRRAVLAKTRRLFFVACISILLISRVRAQDTGSTTLTTIATEETALPTMPSPPFSGEPTTSFSLTDLPSPTTTAEPLIPATPTPGPAKNPHPPGTIDCLTMPYCGDNKECFVLEDGLVCLDKSLNWGYILSRNDSGIPSVPGWSGQRSQLNANCSLFPIPKTTGLAMMVYDLIQGTLPKNLLLSRYDQTRTNWYTAFSNCEPHLACMMGKCLLRPILGQQCTSSWQCNPLALGLNENNSPIPAANATAVRCEFESGDLSENKTCQLLHREVNSGGGFSAWQVILPVVGLLVLIYFGAVIYQRRMRKEKLQKWSRVVDGK
ncbi:hypothetical protein BX616_004961 [Lobosporangium transversale]|uniref:Extracellular membrane protein CFEM domain-containing protein n=1 Tax=Lobosporangium transversale TaxID=64571 RepID=A0A1Y2GGH0_9FUNG|nr:hypothetical protein BCR41DRAFT_130044 [Lobosporangium transversale]KAF9915954.1 hypothetical protein BX616_004961 [Lobosporangium transversale]ORZ10288.1 hypothetical protein BCR41DRAFT_130044 [Lobosporangium transversale]|eukprot:XP_021879195.1 hypothetical protein BCR41DRAFT_130044 [Lobosporangium transversale]